MAGTDVIPLGGGLHWQDLEVGQTFRTIRRTVTEADLVAFIGSTGMLETMFIDAEHGEGVLGRRPVPALLTVSLIEGLQMQTLIQGTGRALMELNISPLSPVRVGDTLFGLIHLRAVRGTSKGTGGVVGTEVEVLNQHQARVLKYSATRMIAGRPAPDSVAEQARRGQTSSE
jgi:acyl dehydratase